MAKSAACRNDVDFIVDWRQQLKGSPRRIDGPAANEHPVLIIKLDAAGGSVGDDVPAFGRGNDSAGVSDGPLKRTGKPIEAAERRQCGTKKPGRADDHEAGRHDGNPASHTSAKFLGKGYDNSAQK